MSLKPTRFRYAPAVGLALRCRGRFAPALRGGGFQSAWLLGAPRRTTTRIKLTSAVKAFGFSVLAAYPPPR